MPNGGRLVSYEEEKLLRIKHWLVSRLIQVYGQDKGEAEQVVDDLVSGYPVTAPHKGFLGDDQHLREAIGALGQIATHCTNTLIAALRGIRAHVETCHDSFEELDQMRLGVQEIVNKQLGPVEESEDAKEETGREEG